MTAAVQRAWAIAKKDVRIYYSRGPVIIFGILFPTFLFMAFAWGRNVPADSLVPGLIGMALFFTASATTPAVLPFETRTRTLERLLTAPVTIPMLIAGDVIAALLFGLLLSLIPIVISLAVVRAPLHHPLQLVGGVVLSALCFAIMGSLFSAPATDNPASIMTLSNLVRLPLIFVSGVFVPVAKMGAWVRPIAYLSPLTYTTELMRNAFGEGAVISAGLCLGMLALFCIALWIITMAAHRASMHRRLFL